jgi:hypothetical protein
LLVTLRELKRGRKVTYWARLISQTTWWWMKCTQIKKQFSLNNRLMCWLWWLLSIYKYLQITILWTEGDTLMW